MARLQISSTVQWKPSLPWNKFRHVLNKIPMVKDVHDSILHISQNWNIHGLYVCTKVIESMYVKWYLIHSVVLGSVYLRFICTGTICLSLAKRTHAWKRHHDQRTERPFTWSVWACCLHVPYEDFIVTFQSKVSL